MDDFKGLKFRTMESPIIMEQFKALGANPTPVDFSELYNALQQGTVDGQENPLVTIASVKLYEVQKYMLLSNHAYLGHVFLVNQDWFNGLDDKEKEIISRNAKEIASWQRELVAQEEMGYLEKIKQGGTVVLELSQDERERMRGCMENVYRAAKDIVGEELLNLVTNSIGK